MRGKAETISEAIERTNNRSRGFDYLRIVLACAVLVWHSARVSYPDFQMVGWLRPTAGLILPMFFALSGYLVSGSIVRSRTVHEFVALRAMRLIPALAVETVLSMLIIGSSMTRLPVGEYLTRMGTYRYLWNIVGFIHYRLPGVFSENVWSGMVNASLWTIPFELECYLLIVVLRVSKIIKSTRALVLTAIALQLAMPLLDTIIGEEIAVDARLPGRVLVLSFLAGVVIYFLRDRITLRLPLFVVAIVAAGMLLLHPVSAYFVALPAAYATVYLGLLNPPKIPVLMDGDYSYGVYLYSFPLQQVVATFLPSGPWWANALISLPLAFLCAAFSWHVVENPILSYRKPMIAALDRGLDRLRGRRPRPAPVEGTVLDIKSNT